MYISAAQSASDLFICVCSQSAVTQATQLDLGSELVTSVALGSATSFAVSLEGLVFGCGANNFGAAAYLAVVLEH